MSTRDGYNRDETTASLFVPGPLPSLNDLIDAAKGSGGRGKAYAKLKKQWCETVWAYALQARIHKPGPFARPVFLTFLWVERDTARDKDNIAAAKKFLIDGLVLARVLQDDTWGWVQGFSDDFSVDPRRPGCLITITAV